jgi:hypothetical protein
MKTFPCPTIDLSNVDLRRFDTVRDLAGRVADAVSDVDVDEATRIAREATYTLVGFGVLAFQRAQVQRRAIVDSLQEHGPTYVATVSHQAAAVLDELRTLVDVVRQPQRASSPA